MYRRVQQQKSGLPHALLALPSGGKGTGASTGWNAGGGAPHCCAAGLLAWPWSSTEPAAIIHQRTVW